MSKINKNYFLEIINCHIISIIILINPIKLALLWNFNININMGIEYIIILFLIIINRVKIVNIKNLVIIFISILLFLLNFLFNDTESLNIYFQEFTYFALPLLIVFLFNIDLNRFLKIFCGYNIINSILYLLVLIINPNVLQVEYMTFGFNAISSITYVMIYSYYNKNMKLFGISIILIPIIIINGNRSILLIIVASIVLMLLYSIKKPMKKLFLICLCLLIFIFIKPIMIFMLDELTQKFDYISNNYSIRNMYKMLESDSLEDAIGSRYDIYNKGLREIKNNILTGMGIAGFQDKYGYFPHNLIIDVYVTFGLILGTIYLIYIVDLGIKLNNISLRNIEVKILFIFMVSNAIKLMLSKTFIYDPTIWLYISLGNLISTKYLKEVSIKK